MIISPLALIGRVPVRVLFGAMLVFTAGCTSSREGLRDALKEKRVFTPKNFNGEAQLPSNLRRVVMLPVDGGKIVPSETADDLEEVFVIELQKQLRFEVVRLSRPDCQRRFGSPSFSSVGLLPHDFMTTLGREYAADAVLFVDITAYRGYRPLALGVRAKLATIEQTKLIWTFDEVFSADDPAVSNSVRQYFGKSDASGIPLDPRLGGLQSPGKFAAYVAAATFNTLPPR
jgi:hypothetical protein